MDKALRTAARPASREARIYMTGPALRAFFRIAREWQLTPTEQRQLLGGPSPSTVRRWRRSEVRMIGAESLERISHLMGIYEALNTLLPSPGRAARWLRAPNEAALFEGSSALQLLLDGRMADLQAVRRYLAAQLV